MHFIEYAIPSKGINFVFKVDKHELYLKVLSKNFICRISNFSNLARSQFTRKKLRNNSLKFFPDGLTIDRNFEYDDLKYVDVYGRINIYI